MKLLVIFLSLALPGLAQANDFSCSVYASTTSGSAPETLVLKVDGDFVQFGSQDRGRGPWSLALTRENVDGHRVLELSLVTGRQAAAVSSSRADIDAPIIGLTLNTNLFADVICSRL